MEKIKFKIQALAKDFLNEIIEIRRYLHAHPELAFDEHHTASYICSKLDEYGIAYQTEVAKTGIVGIIKGQNPNKKVIALRADMDALPIIEQNNCEYKSENVGRMHACGHDAHMASLLGTSKILNSIKDEFEGSIKLIFQPSEEAFPGGAKIMIDEGVLENPKVQTAFGQHVYPELEVGKVGIKEGMYMASTDEIYLNIHGKGGHGALPHLNVDPIVIASHIIIALQQIVSRNAVPGVPTVLSFGKIIGEGETNVIPNTVKISGTFRTFDETWRTEVHRKIEKMATSIAEGMGAECEVHINYGYPYVFNDIACAKNAKEFMIEYLGKENVVDLDYRMTAEDFAYFSHKVPSVFYRLGTGNVEKGITSGLHTNTFDIDEHSLETGSGLMAWLAVRELSLE